MPESREPFPELDLGLASEIDAIISEHFPDGLLSPTDAALATGRAAVIHRDAANDDDPEGILVTA